MVKYKIKCTRCNSENTFFLADTSYAGYYQCWKCRTPFNIHLENSEVKSCEQMSQEDFEEQKKLDALKSKFKKAYD